MLDNHEGAGLHCRPLNLFIELHWLSASTSAHNDGPEYKFLPTTEEQGSHLSSGPCQCEVNAVDTILW